MEVPQANVDATTVVLSWRRSVIVAHELSVGSVAGTLTLWPDDPLNVALAFWPGAEIVTGMAEPLTVRDPVTSAGTS